MAQRRPLRIIEFITLAVLLGIVAATVVPRLGRHPEAASENPAVAYPAKP